VEAFAVVEAFATGVVEAFARPPGRTAARRAHGNDSG
jgi:hypothetical protein